MSRTLAEARAAAASLDTELERAWAGDDHAAICTHRPRCRSRTMVTADLALVRREIATWFAPGAGQGRLW